MERRQWLKSLATFPPSLRGEIPGERHNVGDRARGQAQERRRARAGARHPRGFRAPQRGGRAPATM